MFKRGLPTDIKMRHDSHYVEDLMHSHRSIGKVIPIIQIEPNPEQPRTEIGDLTDLTASIKQNGVLEPILVKPNNGGNWMIIAGERRWRAATLAGLSEVPCIELELDDKSIAEIALIENLQRKDLTVWEEADGLAFLAERFDYTHEEIAKKIGKSRSSVTESMSIAGLPESVRKKCRQENITARYTLLEIARQFDEKAMLLFFDSLKNPRKKRDKIKPSGQKITSNSNLPEEVSARKQNFFYKSATNGFVLEIKFNEPKDIEKNQILKALKETFDNTKLD